MGNCEQCAVAKHTTDIDLSKALKTNDEVVEEEEEEEIPEKENKLLKSRSKSKKKIIT